MVVRDVIQAVLVHAGLWVTAVLFLLPLRHRERAVLRTAACVAAGAAVRLAVYALPGHLMATVWLDPLLCCAEALAFFWVCADMPGRSALYAGIWTVMVYQLATEASMALYGVTEALTPAAPLLALAFWCGGQALVGLTVARWMPDHGTYHPGPRQLTSAVLLLALFLGIDWLYEATDAQWGGLVALVVKIYCTTILYLQHNLFQKSAIQQELDLMNHLWAQQRDQYALAKENIALIDRKCHDMKHQIQAMRVLFDGEQRERYLQELEQSVRIYEVLAKTGNEVLDTVLTEKSLYCEANGIQAHCVADGRLLAFMDPVDLYTIFGNAMDNAIESVRQNEDRDKRIIDVLVYAQKQMLVIEIVNPVSGELRFDQEGLPQSTKVKDGYHGFGLKSIRYTVKKYGGFLKVKVENGCFYLQILLPIQS